MNEITGSIMGNLKKRVNSPFYGTFIVAWILFNWEFVYTMFFVSEDKIWDSKHLLKNDYLVQNFFSNSGYFHFILSWLIPFGVTLFIIWGVIPKWILIKAFKEEEEYRLEKKKIRLLKERELDKEETASEKQSVKKLEVVKEKTEKEKEIQSLDPSVLWQEEFSKFRKSGFYQEFGSIVDSIYKRGGVVETTGIKIPTTILSYAHSDGLVEFSKESRNRIVLTEKGKFFVKNYNLEIDKF